MKYLLLFLMALACMASGCNSSGNTEELIVASERGDCVGVAPMRCLLVKKNNQSDWEYLYQEIEGFNYQPGYEYVLEVTKQDIENPAADQSSVRYILKKEKSKTQKVSDNLPGR